MKLPLFRLWRLLLKSEDFRVEGLQASGFQGSGIVGLCFGCRMPLSLVLLTLKEVTCLWAWLWMSW